MSSDSGQFARGNEKSLDQTFFTRLLMNSMDVCWKDSLKNKSKVRRRIETHRIGCLCYVYDPPLATQALCEADTDGLNPRAPVESGFARCDTAPCGSWPVDRPHPHDSRRTPVDDIAPAIRIELSTGIIGKRIPGVVAKVQFDQTIAGRGGKSLMGGYP